MKRICRITLATVLSSGAFLPGLNAQDALLTGYFTDGYVYSHKLNPALTPAKGYVSMPFLNLVTSTGGNMKATQLFYPGADGRLKTFLSPEVSYGTVMGNLKPDNVFTSSVDWTLMSAGWYNKAGWIFNSIDISIRANEYSNIPAEAFGLVKNVGMTPGNIVKHSLDGLDARLHSYLQLSFGQSFRIADKVNIGYKLKLLAGAAFAQVTYDKFTAELSNESWHITAAGQLRCEPLCIGVKTNARGEKVYDFGNLSLGNPADIASGIASNLGFAGDIGLSWDVTDAIQLSMAVQNLGFIGFNGACVGNAVETVNYAGYPSQTIDDQMIALRDDLASLFEFVPQGGQGGERYSFTLPVTARVGADFRMPFYDRLSFGALYSQQFFGRYGWLEARLSANCDVLPWLGLSISYAGGTYGHQFGAIVNIHADVFNFFIGADNIPLRYSPQGIPLDTGITCASIGVNFLIGKYRGRYPKSAVECSPVKN